MGSRDSGDTKVNPLLGLGPTLVLQWTLPWPYNTPNMALYILPIFLHSMQQKSDQETLGRHRGQPSLVLGPPLVLQWTLPWPYNTPDLALLDSEASSW